MILTEDRTGVQQLSKDSALRQLVTRVTAPIKHTQLIPSTKILSS